MMPEGTHWMGILSFMNSIGNFKISEYKRMLPVVNELKMVSLKRTSFSFDIYMMERTNEDLRSLLARYMIDNIKNTAVLQDSIEDRN